MRRQWKGSVPTIPARCDHETGVASHVCVIQRRIMLILVAFSFTLLPIAIALFMLAVLVITRVCSTSNIGGALGGGGWVYWISEAFVIWAKWQMLLANYIPEGLVGALHPGYKFFGSTRASKTSISRQKLKDSLGGKIIAVGDILSMFMSFIYSMNRVIIWVSFQGSLCSVTQSFF